MYFQISCKSTHFQWILAKYFEFGAMVFWKFQYEFYSLNTFCNVEFIKTIVRFLCQTTQAKTQNSRLVFNGFACSARQSKLSEYYKAINQFRIIKFVSLLHNIFFKAVFVLHKSIRLCLYHWDILNYSLYQLI